MSILKPSLTALTVIAALLGPAAALAADTEEMPASAATGDFDSARALVDAQKYDEALPALRKVDQESPNNPDVLNLIGFSLRKTGKMDEALDYYNRALALNPHHRGANEYLGELYLETRQPEKAKERLAVLQQDCGDCEEFEDLQKQINQYAAQ
ncbi:MAG TPA: tetratricopeptide repeat protein [Dongiaceae bacterium]|jgi:predicted Zn-dependent protease|nr:tetratricopeptide repeat protein [Dongiaceae bacterium]